jgi:hypothetical protein
MHRLMTPRQRAAESRAMHVRPSSGFIAKNRDVLCCGKPAATVGPARHTAVTSREMVQR